MYKMFSWIFIFGHNAKVLSHFRCRSSYVIFFTHNLEGYSSAINPVYNRIIMLPCCSQRITIGLSSFNCCIFRDNRRFSLCYEHTCALLILTCKQHPIPRGSPNHDSYHWIRLSAGFLPIIFLWWSNTGFLCKWPKSVWGTPFFSLLLDTMIWPGGSINMRLGQGFEPTPH